MVLKQVSWVWEVPVTTILKLTIPSTSPSEWSRFYASSNICICPMLLMYSLNSFIPYTTKIIFLIPNIYFPLWSIILFISFSLAAAHFFLESAPPQSDFENILITFFTFIRSVFWISTMAGELLNCLAVIGTILNCLCCFDDLKLTSRWLQAHIKVEFGNCWLQIRKLNIL